MSNKKVHNAMVIIDCLDKQSPTEARARLERWIDHFGHTAPSFGFEFAGVGKVTMKVVQDGLDGDE